MIRRTAFAIALSAAMLPTAMIGAAPARAADDIGLSPDGEVWYDALSRPLFDPARRWVPGDAEVASFFVRNQGASPAQLSIEVRGADGDLLLARDDVDIAARAGQGEWLAIENGVASAWMTDTAIERGGQLRVDVKVTFHWRASKGAMLDRLPLDFDVRLVQAGVGDGHTGDDGPTGDLPDTGSAVSPFIVWLGAILLGIGLALIVAAQRTRREEPTVEDDEQPVVDEGVRIHG